MSALFDLIVNHVPPPKIDPEGGFSLLVTTLENDPYLGRVLTGRIQSGTVKQNLSIQALNREGEKIEDTRITKLLRFRGLERLPVQEAHAGDIVAIAGFEKATVSDTAQLRWWIMGFGAIWRNQTCYRIRTKIMGRFRCRSAIE